MFRFKMHSHQEGVSLDDGPFNTYINSANGKPYCSAFYENIVGNNNTGWRYSVKFLCFSCQVVNQAP